MRLASRGSAIPCRRRVGRVEPERRRQPEHGTVEPLLDDAAGEPVLLQLDVRRHQQVAAGEEAHSAADDVRALAGDVPREAAARLHVVGVAAARVGLQRAREVRIVAVRVEVVAQPEVQADVGRRPQVGLREARDQVRRDSRLAGPRGSRVQQREGARVGHVNHQALRIDREAPVVLDVLPRAAELEVGRPPAVPEPREERVAQLDDVARVHLVAGDVGAGDEGVAARKIFRQGVGVVRLLELAASDLDGELVERRVGQCPRVGGRHVHVVALHQEAARLVGHASHAEVLLFVVLVDELQAQVLRVAHLVIDAGIDQRLGQRHLEIGGERRIRATRAEERDGVFLDELEGPEEVRAVLHDRPAEREAGLLAGVIVLRRLERALRAQAVVAEERKRRPRHVVGARLGHDRQRAAGRPADFRVEAVRDHAELADGVLAEPRAREAERGIGEVDAVHHDGGLARVAARADHGRIADEPVAAALALHAGRQEGQALEVAVGHRQLLNLFGDDVGGRVGLVDVHERRVGGDVHGLTQLRELERRRQAGGLADVQLEAFLHDGCEPLENERDGVGAGRHGRNAGGAVAAGDGDALEAGGRTAHGDRDARQRRAALVGDDDFDGGIGGLRACGRGRRHQRRQDDERGHRPARHANRVSCHGCLPRMCRPPPQGAVPA